MDRCLSASTQYTFNFTLRTVGVMGDGRTYDSVVALRAVTSAGRAGRLPIAGRGRDGRGWALSAATPKRSPGIVRRFGRQVAVGSVVGIGKEHPLPAVAISQVVLIFDLVLQGQLIQLFGRRQRHSLNRRAREHLSETLREEQQVRIVDPDAEPTRLSNDPIVYESDHVVGFVMHECVGPAGCVRGDKKLSRPNRDRKMGVRVVHSIRHYDRAVAGQECMRRLEIENPPYEAIEVGPDGLAVDRGLDQLDPGAPDDLRKNVLPEFIESGRMVGVPLVVVQLLVLWLDDRHVLRNDLEKLSNLLRITV